MEKIVKPYFLNNSYYELHGRYYDEEYSHGPLGVLEGYRDILQIANDLLIAKTMYHYLNRGKQNVHQYCYCGSGVPLLKCKQGIHDKCYRDFRKISKDQIRLDLHNQFFEYLKQKRIIQ